MPVVTRSEVLPTHTPQLFKQAVERAAAALREGDVVAVPTETVYGLAANALNPSAVARIYELKNRPAHNPIIVHVAGLDMARRCVAEWPQTAERLADAFWPGPLSLVLRRAPGIPPIVTAGGPTVAVRWPSHPFIQELIRACGFPIAAPSANPANQLSPTTADHVERLMGNRLRLIVDGGPAQVGIESTVLDLTVAPPRVLRPGIIHEIAIRSVIGDVGSGGAAEGTLKSPGLLRRHYAPKAPLIVISWKDDADLLAQLRVRTSDLNRCHALAHLRVPLNVPARVSVIPHDPEAFARAIYAELHRCDEEGAGLIAVEAPPDRAEWHAIADRLRRAAASP